MQFVVVESRQHCLAQLYQSAGDGGCVLVEGVGGCGKTSLVKMLSERWAAAQRRELVVLHMGEQIDSKVSTRWQRAAAVSDDVSTRCCWVHSHVLEYLESLCGCQGC